MKFWTPIDAMAKWLSDHLGAHNQLRLGILLVLASVPLFFYGPFSGEPLLIYLMSALALTLSGIGIVVAAEVLLNQEKDQKDPDG